MQEKIIILDFGSQYTQLIARAVRESNVYCEIIPFNKKIEFNEYLKGVILSGSPCSVNEENAPDVNILEILNHVPVLGVCYGAQLTVKNFGGLVEKSNKREYGRVSFNVSSDDIFLNHVSKTSQVWMSHSDSVKKLAEDKEGENIQNALKILTIENKLYLSFEESIIKTEYHRLFPSKTIELASKKLRRLHFFSNTIYSDLWWQY